MKKVVSNGHAIRIRDLLDVPPSEVPDRFEHLSLNNIYNGLYFKYAGEWYALHDFYPTTGEYPANWEYVADTPEGTLVLRAQRYVNSASINYVYVGRVA